MNTAATGDYTENYCRSEDGLNLYYREYGAENTSGTPIICLPGLTRSSKDFDALAAELSASHRVIAMDFRGRGKSDNDPDYSNYTAGIYVKDAAWLLSTLGIEKVVAIGTSLGGIVTMVGAMTKPGLWAGAVINDIGPVIDPKGIARIGSYVGKAAAPPKTWDEAIAACKVSSGAAYPDFTEEDWLAFAHRAYSEDEAGNPTDGYDPNISKTFGGGDTGDMWALYEALGDIPVLVIRGALSDILSAETTDQMVKRLPNAYAVTIENQGHAPLLEHPDCLSAIKHLMEEIDK